MLKKITFLILVFCLAEISAPVCAQDSTLMRKGRISFRTEAELSPSRDYKGRGLSFSGVFNFSDRVSLGLGLKPYGMFYRTYDYYSEYFTVSEDGRIIQHRDCRRKSKYDTGFCMPLFVTVSCFFSKRTNASPFVEVRLGKDVANNVTDFYRVLCAGARFGFNGKYSRAVNVAAGFQQNGSGEDFHGFSAVTFLFKVGYEF
jgi:hypothetical protein